MQQMYADIHFTSLNARPLAVYRVTFASHLSLRWIQPLLCATDLWGFVLYFTLGHVVDGNTCGGDTLLTVTNTRWLRGLCSTQAKVEVIVLKAAWHWDNDSSDTNDTLGEPGRTTLHIILPSAWGSMDLDRVFSPILWEASLTGDSDSYKWISGDGSSLSIGTLIGK